MKNTIRASHKNGNKPASAQLKKPTIHGQNAARMGHAIKGEVTLSALRIGEATGLSEDEIKALALLADWSGQKPIEYCREAIQVAIQRSIENSALVMRKGTTERSRFDAANHLGALPKIFQAIERESHLSPGVDFSAVCDRMTEAENAARQNRALMQMMFHSLESGDADVFRQNNGNLAAGLYSLMSATRAELEAGLVNLRRAIADAKAA